MDLRTLLVEQVDPDWDHRLARRLLGTDDPEEMSVAVDVLVRALLRDSVRCGLHYHESVGIVVGLQLSGGDRVAVKLHRPERATCLEERCRIQEHLRRAGLPCPEVLVDATDCGDAVVTVERWLDGGHPDHPAAETTRRTLAEGLHRFIEAARSFGDADLARAWDTDDGLYPEPHDLRFDFAATAAGAEWIDDLARRARQRIGTQPDVVGHVDWRSANVVVSGGTLTAIYDWDSLAIGSEAGLVGEASTTWCLAWEWGHRALPDVAQMDAFVRDYERQRDTDFTAAERAELCAAQVLTLAYLARCEHSDRVLGVNDGWGFDELLRAAAGRDVQAGWAASQSS